MAEAKEQVEQAAEEAEQQAPVEVKAPPKAVRARTCPFCFTNLETAGKLIAVCPNCRGPLVPVAISDGSKAFADLRRAQRSTSRVNAWRAAAAVGAVFGVVSVLILVGTTTASNPALIPTVVGALLAAFPIVFGAVAWMQSRKAAQEATTALDQGLVHVTAHVLAQGISGSGEVASSLGVDEVRAKVLIEKAAQVTE